ncbi:MAG: ABC-F family ATP-binding cassette domain-containing protein [Candidatus Cloacimonadaceae bacterium]
MNTDVILTLQDVSKSIGDKEILKNLSLGIHAFEKIGIVGINGCGKTTLLRLIASEIEPTSGTVTCRKDLKISYLPQDPVFDPQIVVLDHIMPDLLMEQATDDSYIYKSILSRLGIHEFDKPLGILSGGQRRKVDLARALVNEPDLLILDEPTNHLDMDTIEWLQDYLIKLKKTVLFVTHDRYFLDAISNRIWEIERSGLHVSIGNYSDYIKGKLLREVDAQRKETRRQAQLSKELQWLGRGARARTSKPKHHVEKVKELISKSYLISNAELDISFQTDRLGKTILELRKLSKSYGSNLLFKDVDHHFQPRERIGIIGPNGCGKTTLLRIITGEEKPDAGSVKAGINTHFAYYKQDEESFDPNLSVYDYIAQYAEVIKTKDGTRLSASEMLQRFLFDGRMQQQKLGALSGGERKRLYLLKSLMFGANFIILDEPTNDLDIRTLEILEDYLDAFDGCLLVVSHDRFFLDRCIDYLFVFEGTSIRKIAGNYSDYLLWKRFNEEEEEESRKAAPPRDTRTKSGIKGLSYNEQRELKLISEEIQGQEARLKELEAELAQPDLTPQDYRRIWDLQAELTRQHEQLLERWFELSEKQEGN